MKSLYLCGFMGCGKSHTGRLLAKKTGMELIDLDEYIVKKAGMTIPEIFDKYGEPYFRDLEASCVKELGEGYIVATGGGAFQRKETADFANEKGISFFIDTDFETCYSRIKNDKNRPLVVKNTKEQLKELFEKRRVIYAANSMYTVDGNGTDTAIAEEIMKYI
ncbi:MAG: shikimate kinase [Ruminiclostridium sp.]